MDRREKTAISVLPDGDHHIFLSPDFSWGCFGRPWEQTICVFGGPVGRQNVGRGAGAIKAWVAPYGWRGGRGTACRQPATSGPQAGA